MASTAAFAVLLLLCFAAGPAESAETEGTSGFLARRSWQRAAESDQQAGGYGPFAYLPPLPVARRSMVLDIPSTPTVAPVVDRLILRPLTTPSPPTVAPGVLVSLPPKGLEGWYATLPPKNGPGFDWDRFYLRCLGGPTPCPYTYPTTSAAPPGFGPGFGGAPAPGMLGPAPPGMQTAVVLTLTVQNLDPAKLAADPNALQSYEVTVKLAIAGQAGLGIGSGDVQVLPSAGSAVTTVQVIPPAGADPQAVLANLQQAKMLANTVATLLAAIPLVAGLCSGPVQVDVTQAPVLQQVPLPAAPAPAPAPAAAR